MIYPFAPAKTLDFPMDQTILFPCAAVKLCQVDGIIKICFEGQGSVSDVGWVTRGHQCLTLPSPCHSSAHSQKRGCHVSPHGHWIWICPSWRLHRIFVLFVQVSFKDLPPYLCFLPLLMYDCRLGLYDRPKTVILVWPEAGLQISHARVMEI